MGESCVFCRIINGEIPAEKLLENEDFIVIRDAKPEAEGHSLVIPKKHCESFLDFGEELYEGFLKTVREFVGGLDKDFNLIINNGVDAGQVVKHLHLHVIPRINGDGFIWGKIIN